MFYLQIGQVYNRATADVTVTVNDSENATFNCTATGSGDLNINWVCSDSSDSCGTSTTVGNNGGYIASSIEVVYTGAMNSTITCVVSQNLTMFLSDESDVEVRLPHTRIIHKAAQLTVIPMIITEAAINTTIDNFSFKGKKTILLTTL